MRQGFRLGCSGTMQISMQDRLCACLQIRVSKFGSLPVTKYLQWMSDSLYHIDDVHNNELCLAGYSLRNVRWKVHDQQASEHDMKQACAVMSCGGVEVTVSACKLTSFLPSYGLAGAHPPHSNSPPLLVTYP